MLAIFAESKMYNMESLRTRIIDVQRKPAKCPQCGERVVDIIYGTGEMTPVEFVFEYRREGMVGGDYIPRNPPIWACSCCGKRFRKVLSDGTPAPVKVKMLQNLRKKPATLIHWTDSSQEPQPDSESYRHYLVTVTTELDETETLSLSAANEKEAIELADSLVVRGMVGLKGMFCLKTSVEEVPLQK